MTIKAQYNILDYTYNTLLEVNDIKYAIQVLSNGWRGVWLSFTKVYRPKLLHGCGGVSNFQGKKHYVTLE